MFNENQEAIELNFKPNLHPEKPKKIILVLGKMGQGKSTFVRMLTKQSEHQKIVIGAQIESITHQCQLFEVNDDLKLSTQKLYVLDTPGLDSQDAQYIIYNCFIKIQLFIYVYVQQTSPRLREGLIFMYMYNYFVFEKDLLRQQDLELNNHEQKTFVQKREQDLNSKEIQLETKIYENIQNFLLINRCEVISILLIVNIHEARYSQKELSKVYDLLKIKDQIKKKIMYCVITKYDQVLMSKQRGNIFQSAQKMFEKNSMKELWQNQIKWISRWKNDEGDFDLLVNDPEHQASKIYNQQFLTLASHLQIILKEKHYLTFQSYEQQMSKFWQFVIDEFEKDLAIKKYPLRKEKISLYIEVDKKTGKKFSICLDNILDQANKEKGLKKLGLRIISLGLALYDYVKTQYLLVAENEDEMEEVKNKSILFKLKQFQKQLILKSIRLDPQSGLVSYVKKLAWFEVDQVKKIQKEANSPGNNISNRPPSIICQSVCLDNQNQEMIINQNPRTKYRLEVFVETPQKKFFEEFLKDQTCSYFYQHPESLEEKK